MLTLHGFAYSNYYNMVKHALMYKGIPFAERTVYPGAPELLAVNPAGKVPAITTEKGTSLAETSVLLDYLEEAYPQTPLYPADPEARAQVRQVMKVAELYLELPARRLLPAVLANASVSDTLKDEVLAALGRGTRALSALGSFSPYVLGDSLTLADIYLRYAVSIPHLVGPAHLDWNINDEVEGLAAWSALIGDSDIARKIDADMRANAKDFMAYIAGLSN
jgi:glutathione S-transferase